MVSMAGPSALGHLSPSRSRATSDCFGIGNGRGVVRRVEGRVRELEGLLGRKSRHRAFTQSCITTVVQGA
jgi:hypothetical protein